MAAVTMGRRQRDRALTAQAERAMKPLTVKMEAASSGLGRRAHRRSFRLRFRSGCRSSSRLMDIWLPGSICLAVTVPGNR